MLVEEVKKLTPMERLIYWIKERESIRIKKESGSFKPWTDDAILQSYRFCNVHREDDKVTRWIKQYWRDPYSANPYVWFAMIVARLVNWPDTLGELAYPVPWIPHLFVMRMNRRQQQGEKLFTGAYMIHADATHGGTKAEYLAEGVLTPIWKDKNLLCQHFHPSSTLQYAFNALRKYRDMGEFMVGQVIADVKYTSRLADVDDWWSWATPGPGSRRGLNRLLGRHPNEKWKKGEWEVELQKLIQVAQPQIEKTVGRLHAQDWQNTLCETDKYSRVLFGEGKPRSKYQGV